MKEAPAVELPFLDWGVVASALDGESSGDLHVVAPNPRGALLAVIDGLGHGPEAAHASAVAASVLTDLAELAVDELVRRCHAALHKTRGAVMTLVSLDVRSSTLTWCGVGNVEGAVLRGGSEPGRASEAAPTRGGVVGYRLPPLKVNDVALAPGDVVVLVSDGVRAGFTSRLELDGSAQEIADRIFARDAKSTDDALVFVARYLGGQP